MATSRKLNQEQEREVALAFLCGVDTGYIQEKYDVSDATTRSNIIGKRSREWNDPLVDFYRETDGRNRDVNSAHMFLSFSAHPKPEPTGLIDSEREKPVYEMVRDSIYIPGTAEVLERTALMQYATGKHQYDSFIAAIFGRVADAGSIVDNTLLSVLQGTYEPSGRLSLKDVFRSVGDTIIDKVRDGALSWSDVKKSVVHEVLDTLTPREQRVLGLRFGLDGYDGPKDLNETGQDFGYTRERIRQIEAKALRKLRHPSRSKHLRILTDFSTDAQVKSYMDQLHERQVRDQWKRDLYSEIREEVIGQIARDHSLRRRVDEAAVEAHKDGLNHSVDELELSVRTANCLSNLEIRTIRDLTAWSETDLLRTKNFGRKSIKELREVLAPYHVELRR